MALLLKDLNTFTSNTSKQAGAALKLLLYVPQNTAHFHFKLTTEFCKGCIPDWYVPSFLCPGPLLWDEYL